MWDQADELSMSIEQQRQLEAWVRAPSTPQKIVLRSRICLLAHEGKSNRQIRSSTEHNPPDCAALA
jgi:hypothetical protein